MQKLAYINIRRIVTSTFTSMLFMKNDRLLMKYFSRFSMVAISILFSVWIAGCASSNTGMAGATTPTGVTLIANVPTQTSSATSTASITATATLTFTPSVTPIPSATATLTPTSITQPLGDLPTQFSNTDLAISNGNLVVQVTRIRVLNNASGMSISNNNILLGFYAIVYNYSDSEEVLYDKDFKLRFGDAQIGANVDYMNAACTNLLEKTAPCSPRRNVFWDQKFTIPAKSWTQTVLVFEVSNVPDRAFLEFSPQYKPTKNIGLWLTNVEQDDYLGLKESVDGNTLYTTVVKVTNETFDTLIDSYMVDVDNCFGTATRENEYGVSKTDTSSNSIGTDLGWDGLPADLAIVIGIPFISTVVNTAVRAVLTSRKAEHTEEESITFTYLYHFPAAPQTWARYQVNLYRVSIVGTVVLTIGDRHLEIPFSVAQRIRDEVKSLPAGICASVTLSQTLTASPTLTATP